MGGWFDFLGKASSYLENLKPKSPEDVLTKLYQGQEMILRDYLATDRTIMFNEQSLLAYIRTALAIAASGGILIHLDANVIARTGGGLLIGVSIAVVVIGLSKFWQIQKTLEKLRQTGKPMAAYRDI